MNPFSHCTIEECLAIRARLTSFIIGGAVTRVAHAPGQYNEFAGRNIPELKALLRDVTERLYELDAETYPNPAEQARPSITRMNFDC